MVYSKVTVIDENNKIVRYDDVLSDSGPNDKINESKSRQEYRDAFSKQKTAALSSQLELSKIRKTQKNYQL